MKFLDRLLGRTRPATPRRVAIRAGSVITEVGPAAILHGLFSTISANLEPAGWGSRFPKVMRDLYAGALPASDAQAALRELTTLHAELAALPVSRVVWDIDAPGTPPSPHYRAGGNATNAAEFFVTVNGLDILRAGLIESMESAIEFGHPVEIIPFAPPGME